MNFTVEPHFAFDNTDVQEKLISIPAQVVLNSSLVCFPKHLFPNTQQKGSRNAGMDNY
jgi:hypothetical protein